MRSILKAVSWRIVGTLDTFLVSFIVMRFVAGEHAETSHLVQISGSIAATEVVTKIFLYYLHERAWANIPLGTVRRWMGRKD